MSRNEYLRPNHLKLLKRLKEPRRFIQVVTGARQVGKTTLVHQVSKLAKLPFHIASADGPTPEGREWVEAQWDMGRRLNTTSGGSVLVLDEIQKIPHWDEVVKRLWDEDTRQKGTLQVVLLGSAPLLLGRGLTESLAGRFETIPLPHWSFYEIRQAFGISLEEYLFYGAYPGAIPLIREPERWSHYILNSLIETTIARDILLLSRVDKPALLRQLFYLGCSYSGQILSYNKMLGQLHEAGNTTTLAHYLELLSSSGMITGLPKYSKTIIRKRGSSPKLQALNTGLIGALSGKTLKEAREDRVFWGRLMESAAGAHLLGAQQRGLCQVFYWREKNCEIDFVVKTSDQLLAIEVKTQAPQRSLPGMKAFGKVFPSHSKLIIGEGGLELEDFLSQPPEHWWTK